MSEGEEMLQENGPRNKQIQRKRQGAEECDFPKGKMRFL